MKKLAFLASIAAVSLATPASAVFIDFETNDTGGATTIGSAIAAADYDAFGATFSGAFFRQCGGGCPTPANGTFVSSSNFVGPFTVTFSTTTNAFSFENVSNSGGLAEAFDASNTLLTSTSFSNFPGLFTLSASGIKSVRFSTTFQYGVDNFSYTLNGVPEPASWALMIFGFGAVGAAARRRAKVRVTYA
jgi:hypothetical protein